MDCTEAVAEAMEAWTRKVLEGWKEVFGFGVFLELRGDAGVFGFLAPVVGWMVVLFTEKGETGRTGEAGLGEESSCGLDVYEGYLRCGTGLWKSPGLTLFFLRTLSS